MFIQLPHVRGQYCGSVHFWKVGFTSTDILVQGHKLQVKEYFNP